ncbi:uncharacterized protein H6S33_011737 [Morchella sextelata]|uniref:uncharacterized protein n=1 Tax=Morchella sextelata TaxID=1174677 RepID=UPI001D043928|nr:uncharacterized protein H6S33_011737 [Morchella sextelata]KAH0610210.1 hypothetical protein H6S33_011737 [Morchella sextelata]
MKNTYMHLRLSDLESKQVIKSIPSSIDAMGSYDYPLTLEILGRSLSTVHLLRESVLWNHSSRDYTILTGMYKKGHTGPNPGVGQLERTGPAGFLSSMRHQPLHYSAWHRASPANHYFDSVFADRETAPVLRPVAVLSRPGNEVAIFSAMFFNCLNYGFETGDRGGDFAGIAFWNSEFSEMREGVYSGDRPSENEKRLRKQSQRKEKCYVHL